MAGLDDVLKIVSIFHILELTIALGEVRKCWQGIVSSERGGVKISINGKGNQARSTNRA